ncbi:MAG: YCF48-related protein [Bacteroidota bacterium]
MKKIFSYSTLLTFQFFAIFLFSCQDEDLGGPQGRPSFISSVSAMEGCIGDTIVIKGQNIDDCLIVLIDGIPVMLNFVSEDEASFVIPENASSGNLVLEFNDGIIHEIDDRGPFMIIEKTADPILTGIESIRCFDFSSPQAGLYSADNRVMMTKDGGVSWTQVLSNMDSHPLFAVTDDQIWLNEVDKQILKSADGGNSWEKVDNWNHDLTLQQLSVKAERAAIIALNSDQKPELLTRKADDKEWKMLTLPTEISANRNMQIAYHTNNHLKVYIPDASAFYTVDNDNNWSYVKTDDVLQDVISNSMKFRDRNNGLLLTTDGYYFTYDGGLSWNRRNIRLLSEDDQLLKVHFFNQYDGIIVSKDKGILKTSDGGISWQLRYLKGTESILEADFIDEDKSVIISIMPDGGGSATILKVNY